MNWSGKNDCCRGALNCYSGMTESSSSVNAHPRLIGFRDPPTQESLSA